MLLWLCVCLFMCVFVHVCAYMCVHACVFGNGHHREKSLLMKYTKFRAKIYYLSPRGISL